MRTAIPLAILCLLVFIAMFHELTMVYRQARHGSRGDIAMFVLLLLICFTCVGSVSSIIWLHHGADGHSSEHPSTNIVSEQN